jgi:hypothetical protein
VATIETGETIARRQRLAIMVLLIIAAVTAGVLLLAYFNRPPQMGSDEDVFHTVDALYTAVRMQDAARVAACETRLLEYEDAGKMPKESADYLKHVIIKTREGRWERAAEQLYEFMLAQRREGDLHRVPAEPVKNPKGKTQKPRT